MGCSWLYIVNLIKKTRNWLGLCPHWNGDGRGEKKWCHDKTWHSNKKISKWLFMIMSFAPPLTIMLSFYYAFSLPKLISFKHKIKYTFHSLLCILVHRIIFWCLNTCTVLNLLSFLAFFVSLQCVSDKRILLRIPFFRYKIMLFWLKSLYHLCSQWCCQLRHLVHFLISILTTYHITFHYFHL